MNRRDILTKAIELAQANGWGRDFAMVKLPANPATGDIWVRVITKDFEDIVHDLQWLLFSHDFARALWGVGWDSTSSQPNWHYHLQRMVIAADPVQYLADNLPKA